MIRPASDSVLQLQDIGAAPWGPPLLKDINLSLNAGDILALAGPNGSGKSSLLRLVTADIPVTTGSRLLCGTPIEQWDQRERALHLAYLPQMSLLNFPYTVEEVILLGRTPHATGQTVDREVLENVLHLTDTARLRHRLYTQLSGGEKQRTQLARVIAQLWQADSLANRLLLLDEPTSALDLAHQQLIIDAIRQLAQRGCTVILVIHDLNLAATVCDEMLVLHEGKPYALGTPQSVFTPQMFASVFGVDVTIRQHPVLPLPTVTANGPA